MVFDRRITSLVIVLGTACAAHAVAQVPAVPAPATSAAVPAPATSGSAPAGADSGAPPVTSASGSATTEAPAAPTTSAAPAPAPAPLPEPAAAEPSATVAPAAPAAGVEPAPSASATEKPWLPPQAHLALLGTLGLNDRLDDPGPYYHDLERAGVAWSLGARYAPGYDFSLGLALQSVGLGSETSSPVGSSVRAQRSMRSLWLDGRAYPWRSDSKRLGLFVALGLGLSWQHVDATGTVLTRSFTTPARSFRCSASDGPGVGLGAGLGFDVALEKNVGFVSQLDFASHRLSGDPIDGCAVGSGTVSNLAARVGFEVRFDAQ